MGFEGSYIWKLRQALGNQRLIVSGVGAFIVNPEGKLWLGKRTDKGEWSFFGGAQELGDGLIDTVIKETMEETGIATLAADWALVGLHSIPEEAFATYGNGDEIQVVNHLFVMTYDGELAGGDDEHSEFGLFDINELPSPMKPDSVYGIEVYKAYLASGKVQVR